MEVREVDKPRAKDNFITKILVCYWPAEDMIEEWSFIQVPWQKPDYWGVFDGNYVGISGQHPECLSRIVLGEL